MKFGAKGYLLKNASLEELTLAIHSVAKNCTYFGVEVFEKIQDTTVATSSKALPLILEQLTPREQEVLNLLATGARNQEIAQLLCLSESTVKNYVSRILSRLNLSDRTQVALLVNSYQHQD